MNPDLIYTTRQFQHSDLRAEAERAAQARRLEEAQSRPSVRGSFAAWLASWLRWPADNAERRAR